MTKLENVTEACPFHAVMERVRGMAFSSRVRDLRDRAPDVVGPVALALAGGLRIVRGFVDHRIEKLTREEAARGEARRIPVKPEESAHGGR